MSLHLLLTNELSCWRNHPLFFQKFEELLPDKLINNVRKLNSEILKESWNFPFFFFMREMETTTWQHLNKSGRIWCNGKIIFNGINNLQNFRKTNTSQYLLRITGIFSKKLSRRKYKSKYVKRHGIITKITHFCFFQDAIRVSCDDPTKPPTWHDPPFWYRSQGDNWYNVSKNPHGNKRIVPKDHMAVNFVSYHHYP